MTYESESQVKQALGIESWRNLSKDKMLKFAAMMPDIDTEVALKIVEQFPEFKLFALDALGEVERAHEKTLSANSESQEKVHRAFQETREILRGQLEKEDLSAQEKTFILEQIRLTADREFEKDTENKKFLERLLKTAAYAGVAVVALGVAFVGGKMMIENGESLGGPD